MDLNTSESSVLMGVIKEQNSTILSLRKTIEELNIDLKIIREQIDYLTKKLFGTKSEKASVISGQIAINGVAFGQFDEVEVNPEEIEPVITKKRTRKGYSREKALINLPEEDKVCLIDGDKLHCAGKKYMRGEIEYTPATMKLVHIYEENLECRTCHK